MKKLRGVLIVLIVVSLICVLLSYTPHSILVRTKSIMTHVGGRTEYVYKVGATTVQNGVRKVGEALDNGVESIAVIDLVYNLPKAFQEHIRKLLEMEEESIRTIGGKK